jgi:hypothetical protein
VSVLTRLGVRVAGVLIGRRPGLNFVAGSNMTITGADNPSNGRVDLTFDAAGGGGAAGNDPTVLTVNKGGGLAVGDTAVPVLGTLPPGFNSKDIGLCFDPFTTNAEYVGVSSLTGQTFTLARALRLPHANGATVLVNPTPTPVLYGAKADINITDDWRAFQRMYLECSTFGTSGNYHNVRQPIYAHNGGGGTYLWADSSFSSSCIQGNVPVRDGMPRPNSAIVKCARGFGSFSAVSGNNYLTYGAELESLGTPDSAAVGKLIALNNPYGETLPAGIVSGRLYVIVSYNSTTKRIQIAECATPTTPITFSGSGSGWCYSNMDSTMKLTWSNLRIFIATAGTLDGIHGVYEQQSDLPNIRVDYSTTDAADAVGIVLGGQYGHVTNLESNPNGLDYGDKTGIELVGTGHYIDFLTMNAPGQGILISGQHIRIGFILCETLSPGVYIAGDVRNLVIDQGYFSHANQSQPMIVVDIAGDQSFDIGPINTVNDNQVIISGSDGTVYFKSWDGTVWSGVGDTDKKGVFPGVIARSGEGSYKLKSRMDMGSWSAGSGPFKMRRIYETVFVNTASVGGEIWLSASPWDGLDHVVGKVGSGNNTLTIKDAAGATLETFGPGVQGVSHYVWANGGWRKIGGSTF